MKKSQKIAHLLEDDCVEVLCKYERHVQHLKGSWKFVCSGELKSKENRLKHIPQYLRSRQKTFTFLAGIFGL